MTPLRKGLLALSLLAGLHIGLTGCVVRAGHDDDGVYYDGSDHGPWFRDEPWVDGRRWYGGRGGDDVGVYIYPSR
jgi:hypothetical protein